jgi:CBS domain-containing protein
MTVRSILDSKGHNILSVEPDTKLSAAIRILGERKIGAVLVMSQGKVDGIMEMMTIGKFRHLPVVEDGQVVGLISIGDVVKWRVQEYEREQEALRDYIKTA